MPGVLILQPFSHPRLGLYYSCTTMSINQLPSSLESMAEPCMFPSLTDRIEHQRELKIIELELGQPINIRQRCQLLHISVQKFVQAIWATVLHQFTKADVIQFGFQNTSIAQGYTTSDSTDGSICHLIGHVHRNTIPLEIAWENMASGDSNAIPFNTGVLLQSFGTCYLNEDKCGEQKPITWGQADEVDASLVHTGNLLIWNRTMRSCL